MTNSDVPKPPPTLFITWMALFSSLFIYAGVIVVVPVEQSELDSVYFITFGSIGIFEIIASQLFPKFLKPKGISAIPTMLIMEWALIEACTVNGLVLYFLSGDQMVSIPFLVVSVLAMGLAAPNERKLERLRAMFPKDGGSAGG